MLIRKGFRYRIYPSAEQVSRVAQWEDALRFLWNLALEQRRMLYGRRRVPSAFDQINQLTDLRAEVPWLADVPRNVSANLLVNLDEAWQRWRIGLAKRPRWKKKGRDAVRLTEPHPKLWRCAGDALLFPKLGAIPIVLHRPLEGIPKTCTLTWDADQWFASIVCEVEVPEPVPPAGPPVALDRGIVNLLADSTGRVRPNPARLERQLAKLARLQRRAARKQRGSQNYRKALLKVARLHRKIRRQRDHVLHCESARYAKSHGVVIVEALKVRNMTASAAGTKDAPGRNVRAKSTLNRKILDSGWGRFVSMLRYKCAWSGARLVEVPAAYSSQTCPECGLVDPENRKTQAEFECIGCGHQAHADVNAAVILSRRTGGDTVRGGFGEVSRPTKRKVRVVRRVTQHDRVGLSSS